MMKTLSYILSLFTIFFISCESEIPTISETGYGKLVVTSNVENGEIFIGGEFTGLFTPDTLELLAVKHKIKVGKEGYFSEEREVSVPKNEIIIENFNLESNKIVKNILIEYFSDRTELMPDYLPNDNRSIVINYPFDMDQENSFSYTDEQHKKDRENYYGFFEPPTIAVDGIMGKELNLIYSERLVEETKLEIVLQDTLTQGGMMVINAFVDIYDLDGLDFDNLVLRIVITEDDVIIDEGENQTSYNSVFRSFAPDHDGLSLKGISKKGRARFVTEIFLHPRWKKENLSIVSFVQNENSKEIMQTALKSKISIQN